jgi:hypothetical protein
MEGKKKLLLAGTGPQRGALCPPSCELRTSSSARIGTTSRSHGVTFPELTPITNCALHPEAIEVPAEGFHLTSCLPCAVTINPKPGRRWFQ